MASTFISLPASKIVENVNSVRVDEVSPSLLYIGTASVGSLDSSPVWQIQRITITGSEIRIEFAVGNSLFNNIWDNRGSLSYS